MTTSQTEAVSRFAELTKQALISFCGGVSSTFGVDMDLVQHEVASETVSGLKARFNKLTAANIIDSEAFGGTFQIIFDQEGLFTLGGIIAMLPEERILSNRQHASPGLDFVQQATRFTRACREHG